MRDIEREKQIRERVEKLKDWRTTDDMLASVEALQMCAHAPADLLWCLERIEALRRRLELAGKLEELLDEMAAEYAQLSIDSYAQPRHKDVDEQMADWKRGDHAGYERHLDIQKALAAFRADEGAKP